MRFRKITAAMTAGAMLLALAGCSDSDENWGTGEAGTDAPESYTEDSMNNGAESGYTEQQYDNDGRSFTDGATQLSMENGEIGINRRTREDSKPMGDSGWTILVYLCGTDLESDCSAASLDIEEALSNAYSDDVRIVYQTGGKSEAEAGGGVCQVASTIYTAGLYADLKVTERNAESAAELGEFPDSVKSLCGDLGQHVFLAECEICECTAV